MSAGDAVGEVWSVELFGVDGQLVLARAKVGPAARAALSPQLVSPETTNRIRLALALSGCVWPAEPVSLAVSPTGSSGAPGCEVALACAVLAASGAVPVDRLQRTVLLGGLDPQGRILPVRGVLPAMLAARRDGMQRAVVPSAALPEAALVDDLEAFGADRLADVLAWLARADPRLSVPRAQPTTGPDLAKVVGQPEARSALEVAAAGGHNLLFIGRPGSGATLLARCLPGLLPTLSHPRALEVTAIHSLAGLLNRDAPLISSPPFIAPHHSASTAALLGGGVDHAIPGAVSLAHHGVLFLDSAADLSPSEMESLRTVVEHGEIRLARRAGVDRYPARFQLVLAANPCPGQCAREPDCSCSPHARRRYLARLSGPLLDRIDLRVRLRPPPDGQVDLAAPETTAVVRARVAQARQRAADRWAAYGGHTNADVPASVLQREFGLPRPVTAALDRGLACGAITARGAERCLRVGWTHADLAGALLPDAEHIAAALRFRDRRPNEQIT